MIMIVLKDHVYVNFYVLFNGRKTHVCINVSLEDLALKILFSFIFLVQKYRLNVLLKKIGIKNSYDP